MQYVSSIVITTMLFCIIYCCVSIAYFVRYNYLCKINDRLEEMHIRQPESFKIVQLTKGSFYYEPISDNTNVIVDEVMKTTLTSDTKWYSPLKTTLNSTRTELCKENIIATCTQYSEKFYDLRKQLFSYLFFRY